MSAVTVGGAKIPVQKYARAVGILTFLSLVAGGLGEFLIPTRLITFSDPASTIRAIVDASGLYRLGFVLYLVEAVCDISLTYALYVLLRPVDPPIALLAVFFRLMGTALFAVSELFYYSALVVLSGATYLTGFSSDQLQALAMFVLRLYASSGIFSVFHGLGAIVVGWLVVRSGYLPSIIGFLFAASGAVFVLQSLTLLLVPSITIAPLVAPAAAVAALALGGWSLVRGVDVASFEARAAHAL